MASYCGDAYYGWERLGTVGNGWERWGTVGNSYGFLLSLIQVWCDGRDGMFGHGKPQNVQNHGTLPGMVLSEPGHQNGLVQRGTVGMVLCVLFLANHGSNGL